MAAGRAAEAGWPVHAAAVRPGGRRHPADAGGRSDAEHAGAAGRRQPPGRAGAARLRRGAGALHAVRGRRRDGGLPRRSGAPHFDPAAAYRPGYGAGHRWCSRDLRLGPPRGERCGCRGPRSPGP